MEDDPCDNRTVVIDNGSFYTKVGFAGDEQPYFVPTIVGRPRGLGNHNKGSGRVKIDFVGEEAIEKRAILTLKRPYVDEVQDWEKMEILWSHCLYDQVRVDPSEHPVLTTDATPMLDWRKKMVELFLETFEVPSFCIANQAVLSMYAAGLTTGLSVSIGEYSTRIFPVYEGRSMFDGGTAGNTGGNTVLEYLCSLINSQGLELNTTTEKWILRDNIKEKQSFVAFDFEKEMEKTMPELEFDLGELGDPFKYSKEIFQCTEVLFNPNLLSVSDKGGQAIIEFGVQGLIAEAVKRAPKEMWITLLGNIVLGGTSLLPGLSERIKKEVTNIYWDRIDHFEKSEAKIFSILAKEKDNLISKIPIELKNMTLKKYTDFVNVIRTPDPKIAVWKGGSVLASQDDFEAHCLTKQMYQEVGFGALSTMFL